MAGFDAKRTSAAEVPLAASCATSKPREKFLRETAFVILIVWTSLLCGCKSEHQSAIDALPPCEAACVSEAKNASVIELDGATLRVWAAGNREVSFESLEPQQALSELARLDKLTASKLGLPMSKTLFALCSKDTPARSLKALLDSPQGGRYTAVGLGGKRGDAVGFASVRVWSAKEAESDLSKGALVKESDASPCANASIGPCPVVLIPLEERSCGELVQALDAGTRNGRLFGIVR